MNWTWTHNYRGTAYCQCHFVDDILTTDRGTYLLDDAGSFVHIDGPDRVSDAQLDAIAIYVAQLRAMVPA